MFQWSLLNQAAPIFLLLLWFDASIGVHAMNTTIDDADSRIRYSDHWNVGGHCNECSPLIPEEERKNAYQATWRDASSLEADTHFNVTFTGSACYVYAILRNGNQTKIGSSALANLTFIMDGEVVGRFKREPSGEDRWLFNQLVFSKDEMNEDLHNLTVRLEPKSSFLFDYLKITSKQSDPLTPVPLSTTNHNTVIIVAGVIGALVFIGLVMLWLFLRRRKRGVQVIVPRDPFLLHHHPRRSDPPPAHISPFYGTPQYRKSSHTEYDGDHEGTLLLAGARVTGDRKNKYSPYDVPEVPVASRSLHDPQGPQVASAPATNVPAREPSPPLTMATYAPSMNGGIGETVYNSVTPNHEDAAPESRDFRSAPSTQTAAVIPLRPPRLTIPSSSEFPPVQPILQRPSLYPSAVAAAEISQIQMRTQTLPPLPPVSPQPMTATTMLPPYRSPVHTSRFHPRYDLRKPQ